MRHWAAVLLLIFGVPLSWALKIDEADSATVLIAGYDKSGDLISIGSGFFVTIDGHIATNAHVVEDSKIYSIQIFGKSMPSDGTPARKIWVIPEHDAAILKTKKPSTVKPLQLLLGKPKKGASVWALGYPGKQLQNMGTFGESFDALDATLTSGIVSRVFEGSAPDSNTKYPIIQHTAEISPGNSGGPLLDECGVVVGINTSTTSARKEVDDTDFFAMGTDGLLQLLSPRIVGISTVEVCSLEEPQRPETQLEAVEPVEAEAPHISVDVEEPQAPSGQNESLIWLLFVLAALGCGYLYIRKQRSDSSQMPPPLQTGPALLTRKSRAESSTALFRMSGFDERGAPVSFAFEARAPYTDRGGIIGRSLDFADFKIAHKNISRAHLQVKLTRTICLIRDLGSANGTSVNGVKLKSFEYIKVSFGDEICIGTCTLTITS
ncbi:trypsin-like peptidase domain-containing protein [Porticoccaceae bacterium]|nr:trypsin-like peptidase domain-containing protein [Porticoccaceae bacterium]